MAYNSANFTEISVTLSAACGRTIWEYPSTDARSVIDGSGYFTSGLVAVGDSIVVVSSDQSYIVDVLTIGPITVGPDAILDEDTMSSDSASLPATQQSIKAYVDSRTWTESDITDLQSYLLNLVEDTTPQLGGDLDLNGKNLDFPTTPNISDCLDDDTFATASAVMLATSESIKAYVDSRTWTESDITDLQSYLLNMVEDTTPQLGGDLDLNGKNLDFPTTPNISDVLDDDTFATASATTLATSESIKAFVDAHTWTESDITDLQSYLLNMVEDTTPQLGGDLDLNGKNIDFPTTPNVSDCIDDDTFATASATTLATSESIKAYADSIVGAGPVNVGSDIASGVSTVHHGSGPEVTAITTLTNVAITVGDGATLGVGVNYYDLPSGNVTVHSAFVSVGLDNITTLTETPIFGIGNVIASGVISSLNGNTMENVFGGTALPDSDGGLINKQYDTALNILSGSSHKLYLNLADIWSSNADAAGTFTGTVVLRYTRNIN